MSKGIIVINHPSVYKQIVRLQSAGKTDLEIARMLDLTPATIRYVTGINLPSRVLGADDPAMSEDQRLKLAYELWQRGKSFTEISELLQIEMQRVRRMVHRYNWILHHSK